MWFKKKSVLIAEGHYNTEKSADGSTDIRKDYKLYINSDNRITNSGVPSATEINNYFYLPALGYYSSGSLQSVGNIGYYWTSSAHSWGINYAVWSMKFINGLVGIYNESRNLGCRVEPLFE